MFEQTLTTRIHRMEPREAILALLSVFFHAAGIAALLAASWLTLTPIPFPKLHPELVQPVFFFPRAGPAAPKRGGGNVPAVVTERKPEPATQETQKTDDRLAQPIPQPVVEEVPSDAPTVSESESLPGPAGPGTPDGSPDGDINGVPNGKCVGENCDPDGPVGNTSGVSGPGFDSDEIHVPGIHQVTEPSIIASSKVLPKYPEIARHAGVEGRVLLQAVIGADGKVGSVVVLKEDPSRVGFGEAAAQAVSRWRYNPGTLQGKPVAVQMTITVEFTLAR
ncbi:MAG: TonB family protein [Acidobacteria bacterium]|nr:TonB family protein [Acidobacteriota bacterium]